MTMKDILMTNTHNKMYSSELELGEGDRDTKVENFKGQFSPFFYTFSFYCLTKERNKK